MAKKPAGSKHRVRLSDACLALETIAPLRLAQSWDNVGLLAGDLEAAVRRVLLCIDLTGVVVNEAVRKRVQLVMAYHPPLFKPIHRLTTPGNDTGSELRMRVASSHDPGAHRTSDGRAI